MDHLRNFLSGVGQVLAAFGSAPAYRYPTAGDRARDLDLIGGDMGAVGRDMKKQASRAISSTHGKNNNRANQR